MSEIIISSYYFLSGWIANFGVVPLFLLAVFLLRPAFLSLLFLLAVVILVFETIYSLLFNKCHYFLKHNYLPIRMQSVKVIFSHYNFYIFSAPILFITIFHSQHLCASSSLSPKENKTESWFLSRGEHKEIKVPRLKKFTIGNHEIVSHRFNSKHKTLLIKGSKIGFTELVVWKNNRTKDIYQIYILSKQKHLKILHLIETLKSINLRPKFSGTMIQVSGSIDDLINFRTIHKLYKQHKDSLLLKGKLSTQLKNFIIGEIYFSFFNENIDGISCEASYLRVYCQYPLSNPPSKAILKYLTERFFVKFIPVNKGIKHINYSVKLKILLLEKLDGGEINFGLDKISSSYDDLFQNGISSLINKNQIVLASEKLAISTLAEPEMIIQLNKEAKIEIGAEIPYISEDKESKWKFTGLKLKLVLKQAGNKLIINYTTSFSRPKNASNLISSNKETSVTTLELNKAIQLFQISLKAEGKNTSSMPTLSRIPLLGNIFKSKSNKMNYKKITGLILLKRHLSQKDNHK